jgi:hypothetical protein
MLREEIERLDALNAHAESAQRRPRVLAPVAFTAGAAAASDAFAFAAAGALAVSLALAIAITGPLVDSPGVASALFGGPVAVAVTVAGAAEKRGITVIGPARAARTPRSPQPSRPMGLR